MSNLFTQTQVKVNRGAVDICRVKGTKYLRNPIPLIRGFRT